MKPNSSTPQIIADKNVFWAEALLGDLGKLQLLASNDISAENIRHADALVVRSTCQINEKLLEKTNVKHIVSTVSGTDHIDFQYIKQKKINLYCAKGCNANAVSEYCLSAILQLLPTGHRLENNSLGIVGYGQVGQRLSHQAAALNMSVYVYDPPLFKKKTSPEISEHTNICSNLEELANCNFISVHTALDSSKENPSARLISGDFFAKLNEEQTLINTSRGEIIDEVSICQMSQKNRPKLVIDCWQNEPNIRPEFLNLATIASPHIAGHTIQGLLNGTLAARHHLLRWFDQKPIAITILPKTKEQIIDLKNNQSIETGLKTIYQSAYPLTETSLKSATGLTPDSLAKYFSQQRLAHKPTMEIAHRIIHLKHRDNAMIKTLTNTLTALTATANTGITETSTQAQTKI